MSSPSVYRLSPTQFLHVLDNNTNVTRVLTGPLTYTRQDHEKVVHGPTELVTIPPRHYCIVADPIVRSEETGQPVTTKNGLVKLRYGEEEIRLEQEPFPLFPGEKLRGDVTALTVVQTNTALRLKALRDHDKYAAGDEFLFEGPGTYIPSVAVEILDLVVASIVQPNEALKLVARKGCKDRSGVDRQAGEQWLVRQTGTYLPQVDEEVVDVVNAYILTDKKALHMRAKRTFKDHLSGQTRKAGEEWIVTNAEVETHIPDVHEEVVKQVALTTLTNRHYCVVLDPVDEQTGRQRLGARELRKGERSFFLRPGESLESGIQDLYILEKEEALLLSALHAFADKSVAADKEVARSPGDRWMIYGPCDYVPPVEVTVLERRKYIALDKNEGVYVRDFTSGSVRAVIGQSYMLAPNEELWEKELPAQVEELLSKDPVSERHATSKSSKTGARDRTRVVSYRVPHNAAVQVYDYKEKTARVVFGPDLVILGPDEQFTLISLSGDKPKRPGAIKTLALLLGPDFMTDICTVETGDHARLQLQLSYNWHFDIDKDSAADAAKIFQVPDFVGDTTKAIASRVRGAVAAVPFDEFHKNSARLIRQAVFGLDDNGKVGKSFNFDSNKLCITNIDIQSVEPVDQRTRDSLQKSVTLAIEITTKSQEAEAKHEAERREQAAKGKLERQKINDEAQAEENKKRLLELQAESAAVESTGTAKAEASARSEAAVIEGRAAVEQARLRAEATEIESNADLQRLKAKQAAELDYTSSMANLEIKKARELAEIESNKFQATISALGQNTLCEIARAGPEMQAKLLAGLGISSMLITDGSSPINLFNTASGLVSGNGAPGTVNPSNQV